MWLLFIAFALVLGSISLLVTGRHLRHELARRWLLGITLVGLPLVVLAIYYFIGSSQDLRILERMERMVQLSAEGQVPSEAERRQLVEAMRRRAEQTQNVEYWYLVANQYLGLGDYELAVQGFARAAELSPDDVSIKAAQAEALFVASGNRLTEEVRELVTEVRTLDPQNVTINGLLGIAAYQAQQWQLAVNFWEIALAGLPPMSPNAEVIRSSIAQARLQLGETGDVAAADAGQGLTISLQVSLDPAITVPPETTVFVFARPTEGVAMPLAVKRLTVADLPAEVTLSDADAMVESLQLSNFAAVDLVARLSFGGTPTPAPGDYEAVIEDWTASQGSSLELVIKDPLP